ncbi:hypothetical protein [Rubricoccus marinus]|uniref:Lipocalin-like domain-containing protein n=1 Tax=Rubricoccus marinus TaxID=716817 RepID=A0A259U363_9BACT|nr:hypothetical protein [Rubricoccus marinus]OZC04459.1 hypothetical protein BSZ36_16610 [Rubricoccus marinus]
MRTLLILTALLLTTSGVRGQNVSLAEQIVGDWASADSVAHTVYDEHGQQIVAEDGGPAFATLYLHFAITDSTITTTALNWNKGDLQGSESTVPYQLRGDSLATEDGVSVHIDVLNDSLVIGQTDPLGVRTGSVYARAAALDPPEALLGDWITVEMTDNAGVVFDLPFRFRADGTVLVGYGDPLAYRVLGPYLLVYETEFEDPASGSVTTLFRVSRLDLHDASAKIQTPGGGETLVLYRR